jgi:hypothetical protein
VTDYDLRTNLSICPSGHRIEPGDLFCPTCGATVVAADDGSRVESSPADVINEAAATEPVTPAVEATNGFAPGGKTVEPSGPSPQASTDASPVSRYCQNGHPLEEGHQFCPTCGMPPVAPNPHQNAVVPSNPSRKRRSTRKRVLVLSSVVAVTSLIVVMALVLTGGGSSSSTASTDAGSSSPPVSPSQACQNALGPWAQYISKDQSLHNNMYWLGEVGMQNPVHQLPLDAAERFWSELYQYGQNKASADTYTLLGQECDTFVTNNPGFDWTSIPTVPTS